ncbi:hypothetical protein KC726_00405 [Candidatus Woesebacteria bacterium]|nr:hypothetical protein [Candidatus Woesebacteria bacterium]
MWLGPRLSPGLHASPLYYYILFPGVWLTRGNALSIVATTVFLAIIVLGFFTYATYKTYGFWGLVPAALLASSPWFVTMAIHPGNGYTYGLYVLLALTLLWFHKRILLGAFVLGVAVSYHPAAIFALVFFIYEWWRSKYLFKNFLIICLALVLPWAPVLAFEIITHGYIIKHWKENTEMGMSFLPSLNNLYAISAQFQIPILLSFFSYCLAGLISRKRVRNWYFLTLPSIFFLSLLIRCEIIIFWE